MPLADRAVRITTRAADRAVRLTTGVVADRAVRLITRAADRAVRVITAARPDRAVRLITRAGDRAVRLVTAGPLNAVPFALEYDADACAFVTAIFTITNGIPNVPYVAVVTTYTDRTVFIPAVITVNGTEVRVKFNTAADAIYRIQLSQLAPVGDVRFAGLCRALKCWRKENGLMANAGAKVRGDGPSERWKELTAVIAVAEAAVAGGDYACAQQAIDFLTKRCSDADCGCGCCESCH